MSTTAAAVLSLFDGLIRKHGGKAVTLTHGTSNTKAVSADDCLQKDVVRGAGPNLDRDTCTFLIRASAFTSGWSSSSPVVPSPGLFLTVAGETPWTVSPVGESVQLVRDSVYVLRCAREHQRGAS